MLNELCEKKSNSIENECTSCFGTENLFKLNCDCKNNYWHAECLQKWMVKSGNFKKCCVCKQKYSNVYIVKKDIRKNCFTPYCLRPNRCQKINKSPISITIIDL